MKEDVLWTNLTLSEIQIKLKEFSISVSLPVISKILKSCNYVKRKMRKANTMKDVENRNEQFEYISQLRSKFNEKGLPVLSIDTKKKEMIGNFYRDGSRYCTESKKVNDHDFNTFSDGIAIPHGIYDTNKDKCYLTIGTSKDTAEFVADNIEYYWNKSIKHHYPNADKMLILCDGGGSNSSRHYVVKEQLKALAVKLQMTIVVAHYPPYCSKWNPIEHKAFSFISKKLQGVVFDNYNIIKNLAAKTTTKTGFSVQARINTKKYEIGKKASEDFMSNYPVIFDDFLPLWNYRFDCSEEKLL